VVVFVFSIEDTFVRLNPFGVLEKLNNLICHGCCIVEVEVEIEGGVVIVRRHGVHN
jgi:hypothetical protein